MRRVDFKQKLAEAAAKRKETTVDTGSPEIPGRGQAESTEDGGQENDFEVDESHKKYVRITSTTSDYTQSEILPIAKALIEKFKKFENSKFQVMTAFDQLDTYLKSEASPSIRHFIIYHKNGQHWVTFCLLPGSKVKDSLTVLYKDSLGGGIPKDVENMIRTHFNLRHEIFCLGIITHSHGRHSNGSIDYAAEQEDQVSSGAMALRNFEIMLQKLNKSSDKFVKYFDSAHTKFCDQSEVVEVKNRFRSLVMKQDAQTLIDCKKDLEEENGPEFRQMFVELCSKRKELCKNLTDYRETLEKMEKRFENGEEIDSRMKKEMQKAHDKFYESNLIKEAQQKVNVRGRRGGGKSQSDEKLEKQQAVKHLQGTIESKFPKKMAALQKISELLFGVQENAQADKMLNILSKLFKLDVEDLKIFFFEFQRINLQKDDDNKISTDCKLIDIQKLIEKLPPPSTKSTLSLSAQITKIPGKVSHQNSNNPLIQNCSEKTLKKVLEELELDENQKTGLEKNFGKIQTFYEKTWSTKDALQIFQWAQIQRKNPPKQKLDVNEALAVMDRGNELVTGGHRLRVTQLISLLLFLDDHDPKKIEGKLCEIQAGEGKTTIVAILATIKILQGGFTGGGGRTVVDVITSNQVLAQEGASDKLNFYNLFDVSVSTNNVATSAEEKTNISLARSCYLADVVYGAISTFQFDYLREAFEGLKVRNNRPYGHVILDEVDSMLIDGGGHLVKISVPLPGMESLKYHYIRIWQALNEAENELCQEIRDNLEKKKEELIADHKSSDEEKQTKFQEYQKSIVLSKNKDDLATKIVAKNPLANNPMVPQHLKEFSETSLPRWIDNAIHAKHHSRQNQDYVIKMKAPDGTDKLENPVDELIVVPVDYNNTGVTLKDTIWSHGLHQFVQLKHDLRLTPESLTSSCISNYGYIKLYPSLFGMTGTLGSTPEQDLLAHMYHVTFAKVPTFKTKRFHLLPPIISTNDLWPMDVALDAMEQVKEGRAVLIISQTIADAMAVAEGIQNLQNMLKKMPKLWPELRDVRVNLKKFYNEDDSGVLKLPVCPGDVINATNIAGRGADFKTTFEVEQNGGLHICLTFYPDNQRVRDQAFYRTSRQGNRGTSRIILRESELFPLGIDPEDVNEVNDDQARSNIIMKKVEVRKMQMETERVKAYLESTSNTREVKFA